MTTGLSAPKSRYGNAGSKHKNSLTVSMMCISCQKGVLIYNPIHKIYSIIFNDLRGKMYLINLYFFDYTSEGTFVMFNITKQAVY